MGPFLGWSKDEIGTTSECPRSVVMKIRAGYILGYDCPQPTPMLLTLLVHPSRRVDLLTDQVLSFDRPIEAWDYTDGFGNA